MDFSCWIEKCKGLWWYVHDFPDDGNVGEQGDVHHQCDEDGLGMAEYQFEVGDGECEP